MTSKNKADQSSLLWALIIVGFLTAIVAAVSVPVGNTNDVFVKFTVDQPLLENAQFTKIDVYAHPSTLFQAPALGDILTSGNLVVRANTASKEGRVTIGKITRTFSSEGVVVIRQVPVTEKEITVGLYQDGSLLTSQKVVLP